MEKYIAYYRVSTQKQGVSGLGLESQKNTVINYLKGIAPLCEYTDIESGTRKGNGREGLLRALAHCKEERAKLIIAKLDRLSRNVSFIAQLIESEVEFIVCDLPQANRFTIQIFAALAEQEARFTSERTKEALAVLKRQGKKLGSPQNLDFKAKQKGLMVRMKNAIENENNKKASAIIDALYKQGKSFYFITNELNRLGFKTRRGKDFHQVQVKLLYGRAQNLQQKNPAN
jgi:DNA invertase Pin-like site-specific DNA recombinase